MKMLLKTWNKLRTKHTNSIGLNAVALAKRTSALAVVSAVMLIIASCGQRSAAPLFCL